MLFLGPLHRAASQDHVEIVRMLMGQKGVRLDLNDTEGNTPLHVKIYFSNLNSTIFSWPAKIKAKVLQLCWLELDQISIVITRKKNRRWTWSEVLNYAVK
jgi:ankyrin repeat protein